LLEWQRAMERNDDRFSNLDAVLAHAWSLLERGAADASSGMHYPVFATRGLDDLPNARTVLLWRADPAHRTLYFHTDARSPKHAELKRLPWSLLVFYDPRAETQLRIHASIHMHSDEELTRRAWDDLPAEVRRVFATAEPPGHASSGPMPTPAPAGSAAETAYRNFVLLEAKVAHLDWLHFAHTGHRRAAFTWTAAEELQSTWLYP